MVPLLLRLIGASALLVFLAASAAAGGVRIVTAAGDLNFAELQPAVDAAADGDVLLVATGSYGAFTIDGKAVSILAVPGSDVRVGKVTVQKLAAHQTVVLAGFRAFGATLSNDGLLRVDDNQGHVRVQDCSFLGGTMGWWWCEDWPGGDGAFVRDSQRVLFIDCELKGTQGASDDADCYGSDSGAGLRAQRATVTLYGSQAAGAKGGAAEYHPGASGPGLRAEDAQVFVSGGFLHGGEGGDTWGYSGGSNRGAGGDGAALDQDSALHRLDCEVAGGYGGFGTAWGEPVSGEGTVVSYSTSDRRLAAPLLATSGQWLDVTYAGEPGDAVWMALSSRPDHRLQPALSGVRLVRVPNLLTKAPLGVAWPAGTLDLSLPPAPLRPGATHRGLILQGLAGDAGLPRYLSGARHVFLLSRRIGPDCDGNGVSDYLDVVLGTHPDLNHNLVPDTCEPAGG